MAGAQSSFDGSSYVPHSYLNRAVNSMKDYCLPDGASSIASPETGAIVAIILYMRAEEPRISRTKLECYIILLDSLVKAKTGNPLFSWKPAQQRRRSAFRKIFAFMEERGLVLPDGYSRFYVRREAEKILPNLDLMLSDLLPYLSSILHGYKDYTATKMLELLKKLNLI